MDILALQKCEFLHSQARPATKLFVRQGGWPRAACEACALVIVYFKDADVRSIEELPALQALAAVQDILDAGADS